jgi:hypothetical protein
VSSFSRTVFPFLPAEQVSAGMREANEDKERVSPRISAFEPNRIATCAEIPELTPLVFHCRAGSHRLDSSLPSSSGFAQALRTVHVVGARLPPFTGTPIEKTDANTRAVFGGYISIYDIQRAVADKATVPIYYESRVVSWG